MLHEVLLYMVHVPAPPEILNELKEFVHPGEINLLDKILETATDFHWINTFCKNNNSTDKGLYFQAFVNGVLEVLGGTYKKEAVGLEEKLLQNVEIASLTLIYSTMEKYKSLLKMLRSLLEEVEAQGLHGCLLIEPLHKYIYNGVDLLKNAAEKIVCTCNVVFYRQVCNWIIYGELYDTYDEFFICDGKCDDENFSYPEHTEEGSNSSSLEKNRHKLKRPPPVHKFYISWDRVPSFVDEDTAECILFMGRIVGILRDDPNKDDETFYGKIWDGRDMEYYKKVLALQTHPFHRQLFQKTIEECRIKLTERLWSVMLNRGKLREHLQALRDFYALGRGELFNQFILVAEEQGTSSRHLLNSVFQETARKIYGENDKSCARFVLANCESKGDMWSSLELNFEMNWPLHIIFHPKSIDLYNQLFRYLLRLSRTQGHLNKLWLTHMASKQKIDRRVWSLRQKLIFLVNNIQYYLQVDVIEAHFSILLKAIENANEFEDIIKVHHEFLTNILIKTFVLVPDETFSQQHKHRLHQEPALKQGAQSKVYNVVISILNVCDKFCKISTTWPSELSPQATTELEDIEKQTDAVVEALIYVLPRLQEKVNGQHLLKLLNQLDFNRYFGKSIQNR